ncbi:uncharacterized protein [Symphalangus syndactylus]|uniref:uncharacterized protein isoform X3 n=1 Tax=Symphalangus syndactylus TaxID=9590 RepID=UPI003007C682
MAMETTVSSDGIEMERVQQCASKKKQRTATGAIQGRRNESSVYLVKSEKAPHVAGLGPQRECISARALSISSIDLQAALRASGTSSVQGQAVQEALC